MKLSLRTHSTMPDAIKIISKAWAVTRIYSQSPAPLLRSTWKSMRSNTSLQYRVIQNDSHDLFLGEEWGESSLYGSVVDNFYRHSKVKAKVGQFSRIVSQTDRWTGNVSIRSVKQYLRWTVDLRQRKPHGSDVDNFYRHSKVKAKVGRFSRIMSQNDRWAGNVSLR